MIPVSSHNPTLGPVPIDANGPVAPQRTAVQPDAAAPIDRDTDPIAKFGALYGFHAGVQQYGSGAPLGSRQYIGGANPPRLEQGKSRGPDVADLQRQINVWRENRWRAEGNPGWPPPRHYLPDKGDFDAATRDALKDFQRAMGLPATGIADVATQNLLKLENDRNYSLLVSESNKMQLRSLIAGAGNDGPRIAALVELLTSSAFSRLSSGDQALVGQALARASLDAGSIAKLAKLIDGWDFKDLMPAQKSAVLDHVKNHPDANSIAAIDAALRSDSSRGPLLARAEAEWKRDAAGAKPAGAFGRNDGDAPRRSATGPIPASAWSDPVQLVGRMTQNAEGVRGANSSNRCGPTNLLAGALLQGSDVAAKYLEKAASNAGGHLVDGQKRELVEIAGRIRNHSATFDDLSRAGDLLYRAANTRMSLAQWRSENPTTPLLDATQRSKLDALLAKDPNFSADDLKQLSALLSAALDFEVSVAIIDEPPHGKGVMLNYRPGATPGGDSGARLDDGELRQAARAGGLGAGGVEYNPAGSDAALRVLDRLKPGESAVLRLAGDPSGNQADHFITVGILKDGRPYIYNPDPARGDATLTVGRALGDQPAEFTDELAKYSQRATRSAGDHAAATKVSY